MTTSSSLPLQVPNDFVLGVATAAYQIEGAVLEDGRGPSIWDDFSHTPGAVINGETGDIAVDHYHRLEADLDLMGELGVEAYRFSIAWSRILPQGRGQVNELGIAYYERLVDGLRERNITPIATLYHWDLPSALEAAGGWRNRETAYAFAEYAEVISARLGDRVATWTTLNEPWCAAYLGHAAGIHAPGLRDPAAALAVAHHLNLAHGLAVPVLRRNAPRAAVSVTLNVHVFRGEGADAAVAVGKVDEVGNRIFLDPMLRGTYPAELIARTRSITDWSFLWDGDTELINQPIDVLGVNYYSTHRVTLRDRPVAAEAWAWPGAEDVEFLTEPGPTTAMGWNIDPTGMEDVLTRLSDDYPGIPLMVTENGAAFDDDPDVLDVSGAIVDIDRTRYIAQHIAAVLNARARGVDVRGYVLWSLVDNFEWNFGYGKRFGIVRVEPGSLERIRKTSAKWYADLIRTRELTIPD